MLLNLLAKLHLQVNITYASKAPISRTCNRMSAANSIGGRECDSRGDFGDCSAWCSGWCHADNLDPSCWSSRDKASPSGERSVLFWLTIPILFRALKSFLRLLMPLGEPLLIAVWVASFTTPTSTAVVTVLLVESSVTSNSCGRVGVGATVLCLMVAVVGRLVKESASLPSHKICELKIKYSL